MKDAGKRIKPLLDQLKKHTADHALLGRVQADLTDMLEICEWLESTVDSIGNGGVDRDRLESLLIDFEVKFLDHMAYHIKSMRGDMPALLKAVETPDT
jgi:hypothetical protein